MVNQDFRDLFAEFNARNVDYLVVGAYALAVHGHVRATTENARNVFGALQAYDAPTEELTPDDFAQPGLTFQIGVAPIRIGVLSSIDGVGFDAAWVNRVGVRYGDQDVFVISRVDLIINKRAAARLRMAAEPPASPARPLYPAQHGQRDQLT